MSEATPQRIYLKDYTPPPFLIDRVDLRFDLDIECTEVHSRLMMRRNPAAEVSLPDLVLEGASTLNLLQVVLDGETLDPPAFKEEADTLTLFQVPDAFVLEISTRICPHTNTQLMGLYASNGNLYTQCEAEGFRRITYYLDRPDVMSRFTVTLTGDKKAFPVLLSNGNKVGEGKSSKHRHWAKWVDPHRKPAYLFALVAGQLHQVLDEFITAQGKKIALDFFVEAGNQHRCAHAIASLKKAMKWDEDVYGLTYDLDRYMVVAVSDFNMGAMENKGLNVFNTKYVLADPETATDQDYDGIESVIAHEYFHNWTGNRVTCRDWFQLSLKEGLTVFRDQCFSADMSSSRAVCRIQEVRQLRTLQFAEDAGPMAHPVRPDSYIEINNFYTMTVYEKGAEVVRMLHTFLGETGFQKGMALYFRRHDGQAVTCDDFVAAMADANEKDFSVFKQWYAQSGTPVLEISSIYDEATHTYTLECKQTTPPLSFPMRLGLLYPNGEEVELPSSLKLLTLNAQPVQSFQFEGLKERPIPSLLRGFSAPIHCHYPYSLEEWAFLIAHDSDEFNRWEASQSLATAIIQKIMEANQTGHLYTVPAFYIQAMEQVLLSDTLDQSLIALIWELPSDLYLAERQTVIDPFAIHTARELLRLTLARELRGLLLKTYRALAEPQAYSRAPDAIAKRHLKNTLLGYLIVLGEPPLRTLAITQFEQSDNMTDKMGALLALREECSPQRDAIFETFYQTYAEVPLVVDKWLNLLATSRTSGTLEQVKALTHHPAFNEKNPNKVRALLSSFAHQNPIGFHEASGAGYVFIREWVARLDALNPQIAARLAGALTRWKRLEPHRSALMKQELEKLGALPHCSPDLFEVVSKGREAIQ